MAETQQSIVMAETKHRDDTDASSPMHDLNDPEKKDGVLSDKPTNPSLVQGFSDAWKRWRTGSIKTLPAIVVNNSSNIIGAMHVGTEMMMFKASNKDARLVDNPKNLISWVRDPIKNVFLDTFRRSKSESYGPLFKGNVAKNFYHRLTDVEAATARAYNTAAKSGIVESEVRLGNVWQTRSTLAGLIVWALSTLIPEKKDSDQEIERMSVKQRTNPLGYVAERIKQAVWAPDWAYNKRQMIGLGIMASGICSTLGAWRQRKMVELPMGGTKQVYDFNLGYLATSLITFSASLPLLFASDERKAYGSFGTIMMGRIPFLYPSIKKKFANQEQGRHWYATGMLSFQAENFMQASIGGAEKKVMPDGSVVITDHDEARQRAKEIADQQKHEIKEIKQRTAAAEQNVPASKISHAEPHQRVVSLTELQQGA